jgi:hypothetical protein
MYPAWSPHLDDDFVAVQKRCWLAPFHALYLYRKLVEVTSVAHTLFDWNYTARIQLAQLTNSELTADELRARIKAIIGAQ